MPGIAIVLRNSVIIAVVSSIIGIGINFTRHDGLSLIANKSYEVFVPCPEPIKEVHTVSSNILKKKNKNILIVDARPESLFVRQHISGAINIEFDYLYSVPDSVVKAIIISKAHYIIVYGDGKRPDSGHELARELAGRGVKNVGYIKDGFEKININHTREK